jgi:subtilisin-like proprotein convertase family protein
MDKGVDMNGRLMRLGSLGLALVAVLAVGASPALAKKKKPKTKIITRTVPGAFNQCQSLALPLNDFTTQAIQFSVPSPTGADPAGGTVSSVANVAIRMTHTQIGDVVVYLVSPGGRVVPLYLGRPAGANFGTGATNCGGTLTTFADTATTPVGTGTAPLAGTFRPESPLSAFTGGTASGIWTLLVSDHAGADVGTIHAASLNLTYSHTVKTRVKKKKKKKKKK